MLQLHVYGSFAGHRDHSCNREIGLPGKPGSTLLVFRAMLLSPIFGQKTRLVSNVFRPSTWDVSVSTKFYPLPIDTPALLLAGLESGQCPARSALPLVDGARF